MSVTGTVIDGRYEIVSEIGHGGFAFVYQARALRLHDRMVAIKCLRPEYADNDGARKMFRAEIEMFSRLKHTNIVQILDNIETADNHYVVFELVDGPPDVKRLLLRARETPDPDYARKFGRRLPPHLAAHIVREVARALDYAHNLEDTARGTRLNVVHRDVSPQNILVSFDGEVKLTDFGIAKARDIVTEETISGVVKGKYAYMSPEQVKSRHVDHTSDLYSLGIVLYELLAGEKLYSADSNEALAPQVARGGISKEKLNGTAIPEGLRPVLQRALQTDQNRRYQSGVELAADLSRYLADRHDIQHELASYIRALFLKPADIQVERAATEGKAASASPKKWLRTAPGRQPEAVPARGDGVDDERTIIDIIKLAAYSGRRFFAIGGGVLAGLFVLFLAADVFFIGPGTGRWVMGLSERIYWSLFPPSALFESVPPGAEVWIGSEAKSRGTTPCPIGRLAPGSYPVRLKLDGYEPIERQVSIAGRLTTESFSFNVPVIIRSRPTGATVTWRGAVLADTTPVAGHRQKVEDSTFRFELAREGFQPLAGSFNPAREAGANGNKLLQVTRDKGFGGNYQWVIDAKFCGYAKVDAYPADANLVVECLDGEADQFPASPGQMLTLPCGAYRVTASRSQLTAVAGQFSIVRGDTQTIALRLRRGVRISAVDPEGDAIPGARVRVGGTTVSAGSVVNLPVGLSHPAAVSADGYGTETRSISVGTSGDGRYAVTLQPGAKELTITVFDGGGVAPEATVSLLTADGDYIRSLGRTNANGQMRVSGLTGQYRFFVEKPGVQVKSNPISIDRTTSQLDLRLK